MFFCGFSCSPETKKKGGGSLRVQNDLTCQSCHLCSTAYFQQSAFTKTTHCACVSPLLISETTAWQNLETNLVTKIVEEAKTRPGWTCLTGQGTWEKMDLKLLYCAEQHICWVSQTQWLTTWGLSQGRDSWKVSASCPCYTTSTAQPVTISPSELKSDN